MTTDRPLKVVVVGDPFVGKTSLIYAYTQQRFIDEYEPTVFQNYAASVTVNRKNYSLNLFDTTGQTQEKLARLRWISYQNADVIILCFSLIDPLSLDSCKRVWLPEIRQHLKTTPILLVGTKEDISPSSPPDLRVDRKYAAKQADELGCVRMLTCSSLTLRGLKRVFDEALLLATSGQTTDAVKPAAKEWSMCCSLF